MGKFRLYLVFFCLWQAAVQSLVFDQRAGNRAQQGIFDRRSILRSSANLGVFGFLGPCIPTFPSKADDNETGSGKGQKAAVSYTPLSLSIPEFSVRVPVACWYPIANSPDRISDNPSQVFYEHQISVARIADLLAGWHQIPKFASRQFHLAPSAADVKIVQGDSSQLPQSAPVVFLAHGYLGSRFDLSQLGELLASQGFVCISAEYPESLAASYQRMQGLDRATINKKLVPFVQSLLRVSSYGIVGHSLGCGTALAMGDDTWSRVLIAGRAPPDPKSPLLFITSTNDSTVSYGGPMTISSRYSLLKEGDIPSQPLSRHSALVFDRPDGPNHISYLSEGPNNAMVEFLSPLLPVAQALSIPVLDFDKYKDSRDSASTADAVIPLVSKFLLENMV